MLASQTKFCRDPFWNISIWNATTPALTQCFEETVLLGIPCLFIWLATPFWIYFLRQASQQQTQYPTPKRKVFTLVSKLLSLIVLVSGTVFRLQVRVEDYLVPSDVVGLSVLLSTYLLCGLLTLLERKYHLTTSPIQFYFWLLHFVCSIPAFVKVLEYLVSIDHSGNNQTENLVSAITSTPFILLSLVINCISEYVPDNYAGGDDGDAIPPEEKSSHFSFILFSFMDSLIWKGFSRPLLQSELPPNPRSVNVQANVERFLAGWNTAINEKGVSMINPNEKSVGIWTVLIKTYGGRVLVCVALATLFTLISFANPLLLDALITYVQNGNEDQRPWKGYFYILVLFLCNLVKTVSDHLSLHHLIVVGQQMRSSIVSAIYRKSLKISNKARSQYTVGEITNYVSVDCQRITETIPYFPHLFTAPLTIVIAMYFLYHYLDLAALGGIAALMILVPVNIWSTRKCEQMQEDQLTAKDSRIKLMNEILPGIKVLKLYAWEIPFMKRVADIRFQEIKILKYLAKLWAITNFTFACSPFLVTVVVFSLYTMADPMNHILDANKIFVSMSLFGIMRLPLTILPWAITETVKLCVSLRRINKFLNSQEIDPEAIGGEIKNPQHILEIKEGMLAWGDKVQLSGINLSIRKGSLTAIVGQVGSGKSSLLHAMLGEMDLKSGTINKNPDLSVAYVAQQSWIQNLTLKDNILFGQPLNRRKYNEAISSCALKADLDMLSSGDATEIGENGINLSGGQKQRVNLARAVYSESDIYLLDDPLSAVDAHVSKHIFENVIHSRTGVLKDKTRVIVCNSLQFLKDVDYIVVLKEGQIAEQGTYQALIDEKQGFADYLATYLNTQDEATTTPKIGFEDNNDKTCIPIRYGRTSSICSSDSLYGSTPNSRLMTIQRRSFSYDPDLLVGSPRQRRISVLSHEIPQIVLENDEAAVASNDDEDEGCLVDEEFAETGHVKMSVYYSYAQSIGLFGASSAVIFYILGQVLHTVSNVWLSVWSDYNGSHNASDNANSLGHFLGGYAGLGCVESFIEFTRDMMLFNACATASEVIHQRLLYRVMRSPMSFFDTNPTGRIVNRFSADIDKIDQTIPFLLSDFLWCTCEVISICIIISYSTPNFLYVILPLFVIYFFIQRYYIKSSRQLKRLESISKSPIFSHFTESVTGATTIRAYNQNARFIRENQEKVELNVQCNYYNYCSNRWLAVRIETLGNVIIFFAALFAILGRDTLSAGKAGLSISYAMMVTETLTWMVRMLCDLETNCVALERVLEYINDNPQEAEWKLATEEEEPNPHWPQHGKIELIDYQTRYRPGLDLVLKGISLSIGSEMKVGICGRTGAGKSSLTLALFRLIEAAEDSGGQILIDGVDISRLGLHTLRSNLSIIPQDPVLFSGSLRFNLDPMEAKNDSAIWEALEHAHLKDYISGLEGGLDHMVLEGGANFSVGQRQLVCLARALLRKTKILILDEATAAIDVKTDDLIQKTIRREFDNCTVLTIAHRLNTILDADAIAVLSNGKLEEFDKPSVLLSRNSSFRSMAKDANVALQVVKK